MTTSSATTAPIITPSTDPVLDAFSSQDSTTTDRLRACQMGLARLYGELRWLEENPGRVDDILEEGRAISRRIRALKRLVELELREHRLAGGAQEVDLHGPLARQVIALLVTKLAAVTNDVVSADDAQKIVKMFEGAIESNDDIPWP